MSEAFDELGQLRELLTQLTGKYARMQVVQRIRSLEAEIAANTHPIDTVPLELCVRLVLDHSCEKGSEWSIYFNGTWLEGSKEWLAASISQEVRRLAKEYEA